MQDTWYHNSVFYGVDIRRFQDSNGDGFGDLPGLIQRLDYLHDLGINALWLLPFYDTPFQDNGYDIRDYMQVDPRVGTLDDFAELIRQAKARGMRVVIDLVMNHTSTTHPWFQAARRAPDSRFRDYYVWVDQPPEETVGEPIFPGEEDSVWTYDEVAQQYYFHRFYHHQPDLLTMNPRVQEEIHRVVDFWLSFGVDGFRFDAAPIMLEAKGLPGNKMKKPHKLFQDLHAELTRRHPEVVLLGEANVSMDLMDEFFGGGSEMNLLFNFLLGPHILLAIVRGSATPVATYLKDLLIPPETDEWLNFLRNLDELSLEKFPPEQNNVLYETYAPQEEHRIYGRGIRRRIAPMLAEGFPHQARARLELAFSLMFSFPGVPILMYGDELGMGEDLSLPGRHSVRTPMQWSNEKNAGFSTGDTLVAPVIQDGPYGYPQRNAADQLKEESSFLCFMKRLIATWHDCPELGQCNAEVLETGEQRILAHCLGPMEKGGRTLVIVHNLSGEEAAAAIPLRPEMQQAPEAIFGSGTLEQRQNAHLQVRLPAFGALWLRV